MNRARSGVGRRRTTRVSRQHRTWTAVAALTVTAAGLATAAAYAGDVEIKDDSGFAWIDGNDDVPAVVTRESVKKGVPRAGHPIDIIPPDRRAAVVRISRGRREGPRAARHRSRDRRGRR